jgi:stage II sporulation protein AA (anti-sigma F factor antagonist)
VNLEQQRVGRTLLVRVRGDLDVQSAEGFRRQVDAWFFAGDAPRLVLNLSQVRFLDSTGLGAVLGRVRRAWAAGREVALIPPSGVAGSLLDTAALGRALPLFRSERLALDEGVRRDG